MSRRSVTSRWITARRNAACAASDARSGARSRSTSDAISVHTRRSTVAGGSALRPRSRRRPTTASPTRSSWVETPAASSISARSSAEERAATASTALERSIRTREASIAAAAARTTSGSPSPASTAAVIASSAPKSIPAWESRAGSATGSELVEVPEEQRAEARADGHERREHVERQDRGGKPLPHLRVGGPGRNQHQRDPHDEGERARTGDDEVGDVLIAHRAGVLSPTAATTQPSE